MAESNSYSLSNTLGFINNNFGIIFLCLLFFVGGFLTGSLWTENQLGSRVAGAQIAADAPTAPSGPSAETLANVPEVTADDHIRGASDPKIYLIEYSDFECPFCQRFHPTMEQVVEEYGDDVAWVYRHYPLSFHPNAQPAAEASECVAQLGGANAFWAFSDEIFAQSEKLGGQLNADAIDAAVEASGVNLAAVNECVESGEMTDLVTADQNGGSSAGVSGTPGTILVTTDGEYEFISGALPFAQVSQVIEQYL